MTRGRVTSICYRAAIPSLLLCLFGILTMLWLNGFRTTYLAMLELWGIRPFTGFPFLDLHAVLAAVECHRKGVDVFVSNPCDVLGRTHVYSPLWLDFGWTGIGDADGPWLGTTLDLAFILSLAWVFRPQTLGEIVLFAAASCSSMVVFALERANNDLIIFLLLMLAAGLYRKAPVARLATYALILLSGCLKYYPLVLLALIARERLRRAVLLLAIIIVAAGLFLVIYAPVLGTALSLVPRYKTYFAMDGFSAQFLPFGLVTLVGAVPRDLVSTIALPLMGVLMATILFAATRLASLLDGTKLDWSDPATLALLFFGIVLIACFFAGQNINYRGIFFLPILPGLVALRRSSGDPGTRLWLSWLLIGIVFLMWGDFWRQLLEAAVLFVTSNDQIFQTADRLLWLVREAIWWCVIAPLTGVILFAIWSIPSDLPHQLRGYLDQSCGTQKNAVD